MPVFIAGLLLGGLSGGITFALVGDGQLAVIAGVIATVASWLGLASLVIFDD